MEFEVRVVGGMETCFVSLPLLLIQTLESTSSGPLPPIVALELRSRPGNHLWHVAWSGSASTSSAIEIAQHFAECMDLSDHTTVLVRAVSNLPKASLVTIEPHTEDDWEILELNSEQAEASILKQVGIVHDAMRFPLWLNGRTIITFLVVSTIPKKPVVQLVPGTEVAVAPKRRKRNVDYHGNSSPDSSGKLQYVGKSLLRVQDPDCQFVHNCEINGIEVGVTLTSVVFIHPETAKNLSLEALQVVVLIPKFSSKESKKNHETDKLRIKNSSTTKDVSSGILSDKHNYCQVAVRLLISESVSKGHVMLSQSLRLYLRAGLHSWLYVKRCAINIEKDIPVFSLCPCQLKISEKTETLENNVLDGVDSHRNRKIKSKFVKNNSDIDVGVVDLSTQERVAAALPFESLINDEKIKANTDTGKEISSLIRVWCQAQMDAVVSNAGVKVTSLVLGHKTLIHFKVKGQRFSKNGKVLESYNLGNGNGTGKSSVDVLYILCAGEPLSAKKIDAYELALGEENWEVNDPRSLESLLENLQFGDGVSLHAIKDKTFDKCINMTTSSLSWMGTAASDVTNRLTVLLSPTSGTFFSTYDLPFPGHILIYGPPVSTPCRTSIFLSNNKWGNKHLIITRSNTMGIDECYLSLNSLFVKGLLISLRGQRLIR